MWSDRRGVTLLELLFVAALLLLLLVAAINQFIASRRADAQQEPQQAYHELRDRLDARVRRDLRSALDLETQAGPSWRLTVLVTGRDGRPARTTVTWRLDDRRVVVRSTDEGVSRYDFRDVLNEGEALVFSLEP